MPEVYLRTGQAAEQLGIKEYHLRKLCKAGLVEADKTEGRQWRIPLQEIERLKKDGVPPCPVSLDAEEPNGGGRSTRNTAQRNGTVLLAPPSSKATKAVEGALISDHQVKIKRNQVDLFWNSGTQPGQGSGQRPQTQAARRLPCGEDGGAWRLAS